MPLVIIAIVVILFGQVVYNRYTDSLGVQTYITVSDKETGQIVYEEHSRTGYSFYKGITNYICREPGILLKSNGDNYIHLEQYSCKIKQKGTEF